MIQERYEDNIVDDYTSLHGVYLLILGVFVEDIEDLGFISFIYDVIWDLFS